MRMVSKVLIMSVVAACALTLTAGIASAQDGDPAAVDPYVAGATSIPSNTAYVEPAEASNSAAETAVEGDALAVTGGDVLGLALVAAVAIGAGVAILTFRSRTPQTA